MGKSDLVHLKSYNNIAMAEVTHPKIFTIGPQELNETGHKNTNELCNLPTGMELLSNQVGGHMHNGKTLGMLKSSGKVLKPILKPINGQVEIEFYEELERTTDDSILPLREFVPKYFGTRTVNLNDREVECIILEDLTRNFKDPCIMDVKIGRRTWDPFASYSKIINEDRKYQETKRDLGISIPGFMVYNVSDGKVHRYGKDYGKSLTKENIKEALGIFLNADSGLSRELLLQFLVDLWKILHWARRQRRIRLFSSSILLIYDARRLKQYQTNSNYRQFINNVTVHPPKTLKPQLYRPMSIMNLDDNRSTTGFSGQFTQEGPILNAVPSVTKLARLTASMRVSKPNPSEDSSGSLRRVHSFQNNYDKDLQSMRREYLDVLDDLVYSKKTEKWATVKMIDFAHVFPSEHCTPDANYLEGISSIIKILESFLSETM